MRSAFLYLFLALVCFAVNADTITGKVMLADMDVNLVQIRRGLAWHYKQYQLEQSLTDQQSYAAAEIEARAMKLGLWRDDDPMPPWAFRHKGKP